MTTLFEAAGLRRPYRTVGSMFTGFAGLDMAVKHLFGSRPLWHAEVEPAANLVLKHRFPLVPNLGDVTAVDWAGAPKVDVVTAGWPCQPASGAGKRQGRGDARWLWPAVAEALAELRPAVFVGENVTGHLTVERGRLFGDVLRDLDRLGYTVRWTTLGACKVGACHHRHRVFVVATLDPARPPGEPMAWWDGGGWRGPSAELFGDPEPVAWPRAGVASEGHVWAMPADVCGATAGVALLKTPTSQLAVNGGSQHPDKRRDGGHGPTLADEVEWMLPTATARDSTKGAGWAERTGRPLSEVAALPSTPRATDGEKGGPHQRGSKGDLALPAVAAMLASSSSPSLEQAIEIAEGRLPRELACWDEAPKSWRSSDPLLPTPPPARYGHQQSPSPGASVRPSLDTLATDSGRWGQYAAAIARHEAAFGRVAPDPTITGTRGGRKLNPAFVEWMMGAPAGWFTDVPDVGVNAALKLGGNGVVWQCAAAAIELMLSWRLDREPQAVAS